MKGTKQDIDTLRGFYDRHDALVTEVITEILRLRALGHTVGLANAGGSLVEDVHDWGVTLVNNETGGVNWGMMNLNDIMCIHMSMFE